MNALSGRRDRPTGNDVIDADYYHSEPANELELRDYYSILIKRRRLFATVFLTVVAIGAYLSFTATSLYQATAILQIEPQNPSVTGIGDMVHLGESGNLSYDYYQTQFKLLESKTLAARVIAELNLAANKSFTRPDLRTANPIERAKSYWFGTLNFIAWLVKGRDTPSERLAGTAGLPMTQVAAKSWLIDRYQQFLEIRPIKNTRLVEIAFSTPDAQLSQQLADAHARGFIGLSLTNRLAMTKEARDFLDGKNAELKQKLERSEDALNRFRQTHNVVSMDKGENIVVDRLVEFNRQLTAARAQRIEAESLYKTVENKSAQSLSQVMNQGMVPTLRSSLLALEAEKVKLSSIFKPDHPRMIELNQQIGEMKRSLSTEINNVVRGIQENYFAARSKEQALEAEALRQQQAALNLKEVGVQFTVLEEEVKVNRTLYESVLKRLNETNISNDIAVSNMQVTQDADRPRWPFAPNFVWNFLIASVTGLFLGVGLAFLREYFDSSLNTPQHVWHAVALSTLGVIPEFDALNRRVFSYPNHLLDGFLPKTLFPPREQSSDASKDLIVSQHPRSIAAESYRSVRTALLFLQPEKTPKVILLTSPSPGEGKTMSTLNLGIALAQDRHNVLIIDADLRRGCCHTRFGITNHQGLSNVLTGNLALEHAIQATSVAGLSLLSRGICPPNPSELLGSVRLKQMLNHLRESFDFILVDSPPAIAVSDAAVLSVLCDGVLFVFHARKTNATSARQAMERLETVRAPFLGVILNSIDPSIPEYSYYRHYQGYESVSARDYDKEGELLSALVRKLRAKIPKDWMQLHNPMSRWKR